MLVPVVALAPVVAVVVATMPLLVLRARAAALADNAPDPVRAPLRAFRRDCLRTAQFTECLDTLKVTLAEPVADRIVETVRMAREVGGTELPTVFRSLSHYLRADAAMPSRVTSSSSPDVDEG